jgi:cyclic pyranopterin phosphate synthase
VATLIQLAPGAAPFSRPAPNTGLLTDSFGRVHSDLRISVTDHCNIRCFYCMPEQGGDFMPLSSLLTYAQIARFVTTAVPLGIDKIRLTGGEPLIRPKLPDLIAAINEIGGIRDLAVTTNGLLLKNAAQPLFDAGLKRLNIHLDTLDRERFRLITRRDDFDRVMAGIEAALSTGFPVIKLNAVAVQGLTEPDVVSLVRFGRERNIEVRFIEFMPLDAQHIWSLDRVLTMDRMMAMLTQEFGPLMPVPDADPRAPATTFRFADGYRVGFIPTVTRPFCLNCNRLRLTADGKLRNCLFAREETNVRNLLDDDASATALQTAIRSTVWQKWEGHDINRSSFVAPQRPMYSIGG